MTNKNTLETVKAAAQAIYEKKGLNILVLDVRGLSSITDYLIVAEGHVDRHVSSLAQNVRATLKDMGEAPLHEEGLIAGEWAALDYLDFIVHIFGPGFREYYAIERIWPTAKIVDLQLVEETTTA